MREKKKHDGRLNLKLNFETDYKLRLLSQKTFRNITDIISMGINLAWEKEHLVLDKEKDNKTNI